jgi:hypothetical protein
LLFRSHAEMNSTASSVPYGQGLLDVASSSFSSLSEATTYVVTNPEFYTRTIVSFILSLFIYGGFGTVVHHFFFRDVSIHVRG